MKTLNVLMCLFLFATLPINAVEQGDDIVWQVQSGSTQVTIIELYTSQGCSSCPPAEKLLNSLQHDPNLWSRFIPLAFHVDYWNYIGWKDPFSKAQYSNRQRKQRLVGNIRSVYTPGWIVNGSEWAGFFKKQHFSLSNKQTAPLKATLNANRIVEVNLLHDSLSDRGHYIPKPTLLHVAVVGSGYKHQVTRGENSGKTLLSEFVVLELLVTSIHTPNRWQVALPKVVDVPPGSRMALVTWISDKHHRPIQAVGNWIDKTLIVR